MKGERNTLRSQLTDKESELGNTTNRLSVVNTERDEKIHETRELKKIVSAYKLDAAEGARLDIDRLNKRLQEWEKYYSELLKKRPAQN